VNVRFINRDKAVLTADMGAAPEKGSRVAIGDIMFEVTAVDHVFTPARGGRFDYAVEVSIRPL
jgi:hypothetical protein